MLKLFLVLSCLFLFLGCGVAGAGLFAWYKFGDTLTALVNPKATEATNGKASAEPKSKATSAAPDKNNPGKTLPETKVTPPPPLPKNTNSEDPLAYLPGGSSIFVGVGLGGLLSQPALASTIEPAFKKDKEFKIFQAIEKATGLDYKTMCDQSVLGMSIVFGPEAANGPENLTVAYKSKVAFDPAKIAQALSEGAQPQKLHGMNYYPMKMAPPYVGFFMPNNRILVLTTLPAEQLSILLKSDLTKPSLPADALAVIRKVEKSQVWLAVPLDDQQRMDIQKLTGALEPNLPPELKPSLAAVQQARSVLLWGGLEGKQLNINLGIDCADEKMAQDLTTGTQFLWDTFVKKGVELGPLKDIVAVLPPYLEPTVKELTDGTKITRKDTFVQLAISVNLEPLERFAKEVENDPSILKKFTDVNEAQLAKERAELLKAINDLRDMEKAKPLMPNKKLDQAAQWYADKLAKQGRLDNLPDVQAVANKALEAGYQFTRLNALAYPGTAQTAFKAWTGFAQGKAIVVDKNWKDIGIGVARDDKGLLFFVAVYATQ